MSERVISQEMLNVYREMLIREEKSAVTVKKYCGDMEKFQTYMDGRSVDKEAAIAYKQNLMERYAARSVNAMLASLNGFFKYMGWYECVVKTLKIQTELFREEGKVLTKEDYFRLLEAAKSKGDERLYLIMLTIGSTGIRVGELAYITVEAVRAGYARVNLKGKVRSIILPEDLRTALRGYIRKTGRKSGSIFVTRNGRPLDRSNICHAMKKLGEAAGVERSKIFPHNLRHLFACVYLEQYKDQRCWRIFWGTPA